VGGERAPSSPGAPHPGARRRAPLGDRAAVVLIGCFMMLQPMATDFYLASLPGLTRTFAASVATVQLTLSVFVVTFGVMQLVIGPLSDRFGRHPVTVVGLALYAAASIACAVAPSIDALIAARVFQAVGCCTVVVIARAIVRDVFDPHSGARVMAQASTLFSIGPLLGPILGSFLEVRFGFRAIFAAVAVFSGALLVATLARLPETNPHPDATAMRPRALLGNYARVLRSPHFRSYAMVGAASYGGLFAFISGAPFVLIRVLEVPTAYFGFCFAFGVLGYLAGTIACRHLLTRRGIVRTLKLGAGVSAAGGAAMALLAAAGLRHWAAILLPQFAFMFAHGIVFPCVQAGAVAPFPRQAGAAAGVLGFLTMALAGLVGWWMGTSSNGTTLPLAFTIAAAGLAVFAAAWGAVARLPASGAGG
jgi:DHA1 family bicyclomycin/chloramphenicol resistance-like MFS transporter